MIKNKIISIENEKIANFAIFEMKNIPQVVLLYSKNKILNNNVSKKLIEGIVCTNKNSVNLTKCHEKNMCQNCFKIKNNSYFDFKKYDFAKNNIMNKDVSLEIINDFAKTTLETNAIKIYLINQIQFSSVIAANVLLKTLEELSTNIYIIFTTTNINQILPTIKSRCQLINCSSVSNEVFNNNYDNEQSLMLKIFSNNVLFDDSSNRLKLKKYTEIIKQFIINDNNQKNNIQLLSKIIINLKDEIIYFFIFLNLVTFNKLSYLLFNKYDFNNLIIDNLVKLWKTNNQKRIAYIFEQGTLVVSKLKFNVNLNLLVNSFLIKVSGD